VLVIQVPSSEHFDEENQEFITLEGCSLELEHSLVALSKWETKHEKPFLGPNDKTTEEVLSYIECMCVTTNYPAGVFYRLSPENLVAIDDYINAKSSATWFNDMATSKKSREIITSELIYYWLVTQRIPMECETWHLNRLFTLLKIASLKNAPPKKSSPAEIAARNRELNEKRLAELGTKG
jgi:hypothetical protein